MSQEDVREQHLRVSRIGLRPIATPLPLGFLGLAIATVVFATLQLGWIAPEQGRVVALVALVFTVPLQAVASLFGFLARDPVAGTGMGILAGTWATIGVVTLTSLPGNHSAGLGVMLLTAAMALAVPVSAATTKLVAAAVMGVTAVRFALSGISQLTGAQGWSDAAGAVGLGLGLLALYAACAFELEGARGRTILPTLRRGAGRSAMHGDVADQLVGVAAEPGVRSQL